MLFFAFPLIIAVLAILIALLSLFKNKSPEVRAKTISSLKWLVFGFAAVTGAFCFFHDKATYFECRKDANECVYYRSTVFNPEMRFAKTIPLTANSAAVVKKIKHYRRYSAYYEYKLALRTGGAELDLPMNFGGIRDWAKEEETKLNRFLTGQSDRYVYTNGSAEPALNDFEKGMLFTFYLTTLVFALWIAKERRSKQTRRV